MIAFTEKRFKNPVISVCFNQIIWLELWDMRYEAYKYGYKMIVIDLGRVKCLKLQSVEERDTYEYGNYSENRCLHEYGRIY